MSVYSKSIDKIISDRHSKSIAPGPYVPLITSNVQEFYLPEMRYESDCELLKQALAKVPGVIEITTDLEAKTIRVAVDRFTVNTEQVWNAILQSGIYSKVFGKFSK